MIINNIIDKFLAVAHILKVTTPRPTRKGEGEGLLLLLLPLLLFTSCSIKDDLPLPIRKVVVTSFEVEGQCDETGEGYAEATIDKDKSTIDVYVNDRVDISRLRIKRMDVTFDASIAVEDGKTYFPEKSFYAVGDACPILDCSQDVTFILTTYQTYRWKLRVHQVVKREVDVENQVGNAVIDPINCNVIVYVAPNQDLRSVRVNKMILGGVHGKIDPDPTGQTYDFRLHQTFMVTYAWSDTPVAWDVFVYNSDKSLSTTANIFPHANKAYVSGEMQNGTSPIVEYRQKGSSEWLVVPANKVTYTTTTYEAVLPSLIPGNDYECQVTAGGVSSGVIPFKTAPELQMENASFDEWHVEGTGKKALYNPWKEGGTSYWDTGNKGATTVGASNSTYGTDYGRIYANLQAKFIVTKFAAGNIFTGIYLDTDGSNGILSFGRPFESFPTKLQFDYYYTSSIVNRGGNRWDEKYSRYISKDTYDNMRGKPDSCCVYIALIGDKDEEEFNGVTYPFIIRTRPSELHLFDPNDENVIAYGHFTSGESNEDWETKTITIDYHFKNRTPKYIVVVCSSSKYGDYFMGGDASLLKIDNLKLLYD